MRSRLRLGGGILARGAGTFLAAFLVLAVAAELRGRSAALALWLVDIRDLPGPLTIALLATSSLALGAWAVARRPGAWRCRAAAASCAALAVFATRDAMRFPGIVAGGLVRPDIPIPLSLPIAAGLGLLAVGAWHGHGLGSARVRATRVGILVAAGALATVFPLAQAAFFGTTDYRRPADAAVVFGAGVYASGLPSPLLADRIATGVELYRTGLVPRLIVSGGDGAFGFNEALVMRDVAVSAGVPERAILIDASGVTTEATVEHSLALLRDTGLDPASVRLIAVSQAYHLPRVQLAYAEAGIDVLTVPAPDPVPISELPLLIAREIPAFWSYVLRICLG